ncbi:MAG: AraC family transcriptional regulator [Planctomycetota bacterium]
MDKFMVDRPVGTGDYLLMCFHNSSIIGIDDGEQVFEPTTIILWPPGSRQHYGNRKIEGSNWKHSWLHFEGTVAERFINKLGIPLARPTNFGGRTEIENIFGEMLHELTVFREPIMSIVENLFENLLLKVKRGFSNRDQEFVPHTILEAKIYIDNNPELSHSLENLAELSGYSVPHFCVLFKKYFGEPPVKYANQARMDHAAYLLRDLNLTISQISDRLGFGDLFHFSKRFKKRFGLSPRQMRRMFLKSC